MVDVTVRGAGIFGLTIAWTSTMRGARVQIIDPKGPASGASGGIVGALAPHVPENWNPKKQFQFESLLLSETFWAEIHEASGASPGYVRGGRLQPINDAASMALARDREKSAQDLWGTAATWSVIPCGAYALEPPSKTGWLIHDTLSAHIHPAQACACLVAALRSRGVPVLREGQDRGAVVWATGAAGLEELSAGRSRSVGNGVKGQAALLQYADAGSPQLFADTLHFVPHLDGTLAIGSTSERDYSDGMGTDARLDALIARARDVLPAISDAPVIARWAGVRPRARTRAPMLGSWPDRPGHFVANGGFKIGFGIAPKVGEVMADLMLENHDTVPDEFRVEASF